MNESSLLTKFADRSISPEEAAAFRAYQRACTPEERDALLAEYSRLLTGMDYASAPETQWAALESRILAWETVPDVTIAPAVHRIHFLKTTWFRYAAILLLTAGAASYFYTSSRKGPEVTKTQTTLKPQDILPGSDKAVLTLAGGEQIRLDSNANALLAAKGIRNSNAQISYSNSPAIATTNILTTPRGGQYKLELSDGTVVWLNAASSIAYPTNFTGKERRVIITGEAYFEVAQNSKQPFKITANGTEIHVLGTRFNINAYADEPAVKTSLVEGSVKVLSNGHSLLLKPGQQAVVTDKLTLAVNPDIDQALAWKIGIFNFNDVALSAALRQLAKWYDVEVSCSPSVADKKFIGKMARELSLNQVIKLLSDADMHFELNGRHLSVTP